MGGKASALALCLAVIGAAAAGETLAYFTDTQSATNTFTMGNVKIELIESQYHRVNAGVTGKTAAEEPLQGGYLWAGGVEMEGTSENTPNYASSHETWDKAFFSDEQIIRDAETYRDGYFKEHSVMLPGANCRKNPYVRNIGDNPAYVRVRVLIPVLLFQLIDNGPSYWTTTALNEGEVVSRAVDTYNTSGSGYESVPKVTRGGTEYYAYDFTYTDALQPDELTFWNVWGNIAVSRDATADQLAGVDFFDVIVEADAVQASGFDGYEAAFAAFDHAPVPPAETAGG